MAKLNLNTPIPEDEEISPLEVCKFCYKPCTPECIFYADTIALQEEFEKEWPEDTFDQQSD